MFMDLHGNSMEPSTDINDLEDQKLPDIMPLKEKFE